MPALGGRHRRGRRAETHAGSETKGTRGGMQSCRQPASHPRPWPTNQPEAKQTSNHPTRRPDSRLANRPSGRRSGTSCFLPCASLYIPPLPPSLPSLSLSISFHSPLSILFPFPFAFSLSLPLCPVVRHLQGVAQRTRKSATNPGGGW